MRRQRAVQLLLIHTYYSHDMCFCAECDGVVGFIINFFFFGIQAHFKSFHGE